MLGLIVAIVCATLMGFAIQRGGTCLVAAIDEAVSKRRINRLLALAEASLLVAAGMVTAQILGLMPTAPHAFGLTGWTVLGGTIMGLGAYVAGACVFGAIARIGDGEPAYLLVPLGFFLGCLAALRLGMTRLPHVVAAHSPVLADALLFGPLLSMGRQKLGNLLVKPNQADLLFLKELCEAGKVKPTIDRRFALSEVPAAIRYVEDGHARGKVVVTVCDDRTRT